jgi:hypothetical protein
MRVRRCLVLMLATMICTGCIQVKETLRLKKDGSGTVHITVSFLQLGLRWLPGKPAVDWLRPNLPDGVRLTSFENVQSKMKFPGEDGKEHDLVSEVYDVNLAFADVASLNDIRVRPDTRNAMAASAGGTPGKDGAGNMSSQENAGPNTGPFQNVMLTKNDGVLHFRRVVQAARDPDDVEADSQSTPGSSARPEAFDLRTSAMEITISCPGDVVEHNAHQVEGRNLTWKFELKKLQQHQDRDWIVEFKCRSEGE